MGYFAFVHPFSPSAPPGPLPSSCRYKNLQKSYPWYSNITRRRLEVLGRTKIEPDFDKATEYFYAMLGYLDALQRIQYEIRLVSAEEPVLLPAVQIAVAGDSNGCQ